MNLLKKIKKLLSKKQPNIHKFARDLTTDEIVLLLELATSALRQRKE